MAYLVILTGPRIGQWFELKESPCVIGREPGCHICVRESLCDRWNTVSRKHAELRREGSRWLLRDLDSTNGTLLNLRRCMPLPVELRPGDVIQLGSLALVYASAVPLGRLPDPGHPPNAARRPGDYSSGSASVAPPWDAPDSSLDDSAVAPVLEKNVRPPDGFFFRELAARLQSNHMLCPHLTLEAFRRELDADQSPFRDSLSGFHRIVELDAAEGVDERACFDLGRFFQYATRQLGGAFGCPAPAEEFHPEALFQLLKDEPRSLIVIGNIHLIDEESMGRMRGFTQESHQVLFCGEHSLFGIKHERLS